MKAFTQLLDDFCTASEARDVPALGRGFSGEHCKHTQNTKDGRTCIISASNNICSACLRAARNPWMQRTCAPKNKCQAHFYFLGLAESRTLK